MIKVDIMSVRYTDINISGRDIPKLRGYFANKYRENTLFHNHLGTGFNYAFPKIHFRAIDNNPVLIGINEGIEVLKEIVFNEDEINIDGKTYQVNEKNITQKTCPFGEAEGMIHYKFISPWMALNEENYKVFNTLSDEDKWFFLNRLLRENFKTLAKGFNYFIPDIESIQVEGKYYNKLVNFKNQKMLCFTGWFKTNFHIPDYFGLGKQSARGFGSIVKQEKKGVKDDSKTVWNG